jgi:hypothetical protein
LATADDMADMDSVVESDASGTTKKLRKILSLDSDALDLATEDWDTWVELVDGDSVVELDASGTMKKPKKIRLLDSAGGEDLDTVVVSADGGSVVVDASGTMKKISKTTKMPSSDCAEWAGWDILEWVTVLVSVFMVCAHTAWVCTDWVCWDVVTDWALCAEDFGMKTNPKKTTLPLDVVMVSADGVVVSADGASVDFGTKRTN